jgi:hypothetical protein
VPDPTASTPIFEELQSLAGLVLAVVELLRQLMERQAIRRAEFGDLDDEQIEKLGLTLMRLEEGMDECAPTSN